MKRSALVMGLVVFLAVVLAAGTIFAQTKKPPPPNCSYTVEKDKSGQVQYVLTGPDCKAFVAKMKQQPVQKGKAYGAVYCEGKCVCTLETGSDIWICRGCCPWLFEKLTPR